MTQYHHLTGTASRLMDFLTICSNIICSHTIFYSRPLVLCAGVNIDTPISIIVREHWADRQKTKIVLIVIDVYSVAKYLARVSSIIIISIISILL